MKIYENGEVSLFSAFQFLFVKANLRSILIYSFFGFIAGLILSFTTPNEYLTSTTLIPNMVSSEGSKIPSSLSNIAGLAGVNIADENSANQLPVSLYSSILRTKTFKDSLLNKKFFFKGDSIDFKYYIENYKKSSLLPSLLKVPWKIVSWVKGTPTQLIDTKDKGLIVVDKEKLKLYSLIDSWVQVDVDELTLVVSISATTQDSNLSVQLIRFVKSYLMSYIKEYSLVKNKENLFFINEVYKDRKQEMLNLRDLLSKFYEENQNLSSRKKQFELKSLESDYNILVSSVTELQIEIDKLNVTIQKETPVFTVLNPIYYPQEKSAPSRMLILIGVMLLTSFLRIFVILFMKIAEDLKGAPE